MAQGDITERITDMHIDYGRNKVTVQIQRIIELPDGSLWSLDQRIEEKDYETAEAMEAKPMTELKLQVAKLDVLVDTKPLPMDK